MNKSFRRYFILTLVLLLTLAPLGSILMQIDELKGSMQGYIIAIILIIVAIVYYTSFAIYFHFNNHSKGKK